jgi:hypothetical protein
LLGRDLVELAVWPGPPAHPAHQVTIGRIITEVDELRGIALRLAEADADAFTAVTGACKLPRSTEEEKAARSAAIAQALVSAAWPPAQVISVAGMVVDLAQALAAIGNPNVISDDAAAAEGCPRRVQPGRQFQRPLDPEPAGIREARGLHREPHPQPSLTVERGDRVQRHRHQQPPLARTHAPISSRCHPVAAASREGRPAGQGADRAARGRAVHALVMLAEIGDITRFPSVRKLASWAGLG